MPALISEDAKKDLRRYVYMAEEIFNEWQAYRRGLCLCKSRLLIAITSMWHDKERMKSFHEITVPDRFKDAAFLTYWFNKVHPVQTTCEYVEGKHIEAKLLANAEFALACALARMKVRIGYIDKIFYRNILYTLTYRYVSPEHLALTYTALFLPPPE